MINLDNVDRPAILAEVTAAFYQYEEALVSNNIEALDALFWHDPRTVRLRFLIEMYFKAIDPTSLNQQGEDRGTRYRTGIYYTDPADRTVVEEVMAEVAKTYTEQLQVELAPLQCFYKAEDYHQDYLKKNPTGYCHLPVALFELARQAKDRR